MRMVGTDNTYKPYLQVVRNSGGMTCPHVAAGENGWHTVAVGKRIV